MEKVTPIDLERAQIPVTFRGYSREAVDHILASASKQLEGQLVEIRRLQQAHRDAERDLETFRLQESTLRDAIVLAQKSADEARAVARREAEVIVEEARLEAKEIRRSANEAVRALKWEIERLESDRAGFAARFRSLLQDYLSHLEEAPPTHAVLAVETPEAAAG
ncbi:MAG: DivIVA domain-containing protein [Armatimonadetes bacterium]|nr:DivIVA domain-containing protein [Armatimonadota bacterium]